jgi:chromosome segregation ATPase
MDVRIDSIRKRLEERLDRLESRIKGPAAPRPGQDVRESAAPREVQQKTFMDEHSLEKQNLETRIRVQKREIDSLKEQLEGGKLKMETLKEEFRQQQVNIAGLVADWEQRLSAARERDTCDNAMKGDLEKAVAFLKADIAAQTQRIEILTVQKQEYEETINSKDGEITRLFAKIENLESENEMLIRKVGSYQLAARTTRAQHAPLPEPAKENRRLFRWLAKPLIVLRTGDEINH